MDRPGFGLAMASWPDPWNFEDLLDTRSQVCSLLLCVRVCGCARAGACARVCVCVRMCVCVSHASVSI